MIIKNCAVFNKQHQICNKKSKVVKCQDITDCVMKKIYATCKQEISVNNADAPTNAYAMGRVVVAEKILDLLDIEECEQMYD